MGDFDGWSRGIDLSAEDASGDSVFTRFTATLLLPKVTAVHSRRQLVKGFVSRMVQLHPRHAAGCILLHGAVE